MVVLPAMGIMVKWPFRERVVKNAVSHAVLLFLAGSLCDAFPKKSKVGWADSGMSLFQVELLLNKISSDAGQRVRCRSIAL